MRGMCAQTAAGDRMSSVMKRDFGRRKQPVKPQVLHMEAALPQLCDLYDLFVLRGDFSLLRTEKMPEEFVLCSAGDKFMLQTGKFDCIKDSVIGLMMISSALSAFEKCLYHKDIRRSLETLSFFYISSLKCTSQLKKKHLSTNLELLCGCFPSRTWLLINLSSKYLFSILFMSTLAHDLLLRGKKILNNDLSVFISKAKWIPAALRIMSIWVK